MARSSDSQLLWWDREYGQNGKLLRLDVRNAAHKVWPYLSYLGRNNLRDFEGEGPALMEQVVEYVSAYLDDKDAPQHNPSGLIIVSFRHELYRLAAKQNKTIYAGSAVELSKWLQSSAPADELDQQIVSEEVIRLLRPQNQGILRLRIAGYQWKEIAGMLGGNVSTVRNDFWRDVKRSFTELLEPGTQSEKGTR
jgi:DNA-directed RNA polymerase specialized sigma24 family protein